MMDKNIPKWQEDLFIFMLALGMIAIVLIIPNPTTQINFNFTGQEQPTFSPVEVCTQWEKSQFPLDIICSDDGSCARGYLSKNQEYTISSIGIGYVTKYGGWALRKILSPEEVEKLYTITGEDEHDTEFISLDKNKVREIILNNDVDDRVGKFHFGFFIDYPTCTKYESLDTSKSAEELKVCECIKSSSVLKIDNKITIININSLEEIRATEKESYSIEQACIKQTCSVPSWEEVKG